MQERKPCNALTTPNQQNVILQFFNKISIENCPQVWALEIFIDVTSVCHLCCSRLTNAHSKGYVVIRNGY